MRVFFVILIFIQKEYIHETNGTLVFQATMPLLFVNFLLANLLMKQTAEHPTFCYWSPHMKKDKEKEGKTSNRADRPFRRHANVYFAKYMNIVGTRTSLMGVQILQNTQQSLASTII